MASHRTLLFSLCLLSLATLSFSANHRFSAVADVHDLLPKYGLPKGILPGNVKSYTLSDNGAFTIELTSPCYVHFDELVYYDTKITGKISYGSVHDVVGIQAKKLFVWVPVTAMEADPDTGMIEFFVGFISEKLPAKQFEDIPVCKSKAALENNLVDSM